MQKIEYIGIKEDNKPLRIINSNLLKLDCSKLSKDRYRLIIEKNRKKKSNQQLAYLFACVYPLVLTALNDAGWEFTSIEEVDEYCKSMFSDKEILNRNTGVILNIPGLKRNMTTIEMMTYINSIRDWVAEFLNVYIPEPEQQINMQFK